MVELFTKSSKGSSFFGLNKKLDKIYIEMAKTKLKVHHIQPSCQTHSKTVVELIESHPQFSIFLSLLIQTDLLGTIADLATKTVFAPTNKAFNDLPPEVFEALMADNDLLRQVLLYHISPEVVSTVRVKCFGPLKIPTLLQLNTFVQKLAVVSFLTKKKCDCPTIVRVIDNTHQKVKVEEQLKANDGFVQVLDQVLFPFGI